MRKHILFNDKIAFEAIEKSKLMGMSFSSFVRYCVNKELRRNNGHRTKTGNSTKSEYQESSV